MKNMYLYNTEIGKLRIVDNDKEIIEIRLHEESEKPEEEYSLNETELIKKAYNELSEYFSGKRKQFSLPLKLEGTEFQKKVWKALLEIPYGEVRSYKQIAEKIGCEKRL